jgi:hypothetical protein
MKNKSKSSRKSKQALAGPESTCQSCLRQAEICCEQARAAARLKRLKAACGLFATAQALLKRAISAGGEACGEAREEARERLNSISAEMATYCELAKSAARPMHASQAHDMVQAPLRLPVQSSPGQYPPARSAPSHQTTQPGVRITPPHKDGR